MIDTTSRQSRITARFSPTYCHVGADGQRQQPGCAAQHLRKRRLGGLGRFVGWGGLGAVGLRLLFSQEVRRFVDTQPDHETHDQQHRRKQERHAPSPAEERRVVQARHQLEHQHRQDQPGGAAQLREGREEGALALVRRMLTGHQDRPAPFAAHGNPLHDPQQDQQNGCPEADGRIGGQQADQHRDRAHHDQRDHQGFLAADLVADVAEDRAAQRPGEEAHRERAQGGQGSVEARGRREKEFAEHQRGSGGVDVEVEELNGGADQAGQQDTAGGIHGRCGSAGRRHRQHGLRHRSLHGCLADGCSCVVVVRFAEAAAHGGVAGGTAGAWPDGAVVVGQWPDRAAR
ncbi:hypothetical protein G6F35_011297 [Rhizopus arrhizus]|nr:hypothetical protein G6F35_011297 [Rhizopus arrhizus]